VAALESGASPPSIGKETSGPGDTSAPAALAPGGDSDTGGVAVGEPSIGEDGCVTGARAAVTSRLPLCIVAGSKASDVAVPTATALKPAATAAGETARGTARAAARRRRATAGGLVAFGLRKTTLIVGRRIGRTTSSGGSARLACRAQPILS
jgi:hypothetical protein